MDKRLPIVDIAPLIKNDPQTLEFKNSAKLLYEALHEVGFAIIVGHQVSAKTIAAMRKAVATVFETPRKVLMQDMVVKGNYRGFVPLGFFTPNSGKGNADQYEAWKLHNETDSGAEVCKECNLYGPNKWPDIPQDIKTPVLNYWHELTRVSEYLIIALCKILQIDEKFVLSCMTNPLTNMTLLNYPPTPQRSDTWGQHPHKDFNLLTLLAHDPVGGLEVRTLDEQWINAECSTDAMVLNVGDMLELWSGGRLISTPHRVTNRSGKSRQSFPYFSKPRWDVVIEPLLSPVPEFDRAPLHVGTSAANIWYSNWPDSVSPDSSQHTNY
ncbi:MAG: isopenicillin N synthase family oxygenase [Actinobacteria bacterium]|nr:MAG: isopenicillin N synthase family oxygenase [Actinomycetota bacterium]